MRFPEFMTNVICDPSLRPWKEVSSTVSTSGSQVCHWRGAKQVFQTVSREALAIALRVTNPIEWFGWFGGLVVGSFATVYSFNNTATSVKNDERMVVRSRRVGVQSGDWCDA